MTQHIKYNDDEGQQGNANHSRNPENRVVDKATLIFRIIIIALVTGSFIVENIYADNEIVNTMLGGLNILYFSFVMVSIMDLVYNYRLNKKSRNLPYIIKNLLIYPFLLILGYVLTIIFIKSLWSIIIWLPVMTIIAVTAIAGSAGSKNDQFK